MTETWDATIVRDAQAAEDERRDIEAGKETNLSADEWLRIARTSGAPEYMKGDTGGPCPF